MPIGEVKWYDCLRGYGFIIGPEGQDVFVHYKVIEGEGFRKLWDGDRVEYEVELGPRGYHATHVRRLDPDPRKKKNDPPSA